MKVKVIGEAPARGTEQPWEGRSGARMALLLGPTWEVAERVNVFDSPMDQDGKGSDFPMEAARVRAERMDLADVNLLAGKRVAQAFGIRETYFELQRVRGVIVVVIPHPSGGSLWWNDAVNLESALVFFRAVRLMAGEEPDVVLAHVEPAS